MAVSEPTNVSVTRTIHIILSKPLTAFPHNHFSKNDLQRERDREMNPVTIAIINPWKEIGRAWHQTRHLLMSCMLQTELGAWQLKQTQKKGFKYLSEFYVSLPNLYVGILVHLGTL